MDLPRSDRTYRGVVAVFGALFRLWGYRFDVRGAEHLPAHGPAVIASNHIGFLDFTFIGYAARERGRLVRFMSKRSVFDSRFAGWLMRRMGHIPVDRASGAVAYRRAGRLLDAGQLVGLFPEATISRSWLLKRFRPGAAGLALRHGVPVVPVVVWGGHRILTVDGHRSLRRGIAISIHVGEPLETRPDESVADLTARVRVAMSDLLDTAISDYPDEPRDDDDRWWLPHDRGGTAPDPEAAHELDRAALARIGETLD
ncbi:Acyltransferase [Aeromicrobium marinum DSM 15272]|uniref:Acyltransferase n=1 Tax=Aeromicrobium marinum DSM 15272 TaxID=585531 RepID=E2SBX1_9ACTN|nr:lysophospholipid acyltransferase family protein [Aeromicrobium marinum]EFQ83257.1 Acyltransferase [Aeromicrobium marinum DSM 15272]